MTITPDELDTQKMFTRIERELGEIRTSTERTEKALFGNGQPGLVERVVKLETDAHSIQDTINGKPSLVERVTKLETKVGMVSAIAGAVTGIVGGCIAEIIKHLF